MSTRPLRPAALLALAGAFAVVLSLWLPWYHVDLSAALKAAFGDVPAAGTAPAGSPAGAFAGAIAGLAQGLLSAMPHDVTVSGWTALNGADIALAVLAAVALLSLLDGVQAVLAARLVTLAGLVVTGIVAVHAADPPGPGGVVDLRPGIWVALAGGLLMAIGGWRSAAGAAAAPSPPPVASPFGPPVAPGSSVAPPGFGESR
jgi:hypothetical protein